MKTKLKLVISTLLVGLFINVGHAEQPLGGSISTKFTSDVFDRGQVVSEEALQGSVKLNSNIGAINAFGTFSTSQSSKSAGSDLDQSTLGAGTSFSDGLIGASVGIYKWQGFDSESELGGLGPCGCPARKSFCLVRACVRARTQDQ